jgi:hypothetical protein
MKMTIKLPPLPETTLAHIRNEHRFGRHIDALQLALAARELQLLDALSALAMKEEKQ